MSQSNLGGASLPTTIAFDQAFRAVTATLCNDRYPLLEEVDASDKEEWGEHFDPEEVRLALSCCITAALDALGVPEPAGDQLDWLGDLHDLVLESRPVLAEYLDATTDQGGES